MTDLVEGRTGQWEVVIGLEVHAQVSSNAKLFSGASTDFGAEPNANVSLVDAAMPGMLPLGTSCLSCMSWISWIYIYIYSGIIWYIVGIFVVYMLVCFRYIFMNEYLYCVDM